MSGRPWIVLPTFNESDSLPGVVSAVRAGLPEARVLAVDDSSPYGSGRWSVPPPALRTQPPMGGTPWIMLPTFNDTDSLPGVVSAVRAALPEARVLVVDDSSPDGTAAVAERLGVEVLPRPVKK